VQAEAAERHRIRFVFTDCEFDKIGHVGAFVGNAREPPKQHLLSSYASRPWREILQCLPTKHLTFKCYALQGKLQLARKPGYIHLVFAIFQV